MRYKCERCEEWIKDKFIFGLLHLCLTEEEYSKKLEYYKNLRDRQEKEWKTE